MVTSLFQDLSRVVNILYEKKKPQEINLAVYNKII